MQKGIKFRIYPNREQENLINQTLGCCRLIYNKGLAMRKEAYANGEKVGYTQTSAMLTALKKCEDFSLCYCRISFGGIILRKYRCNCRSSRFFDCWLS